jgi:acid phosphatase
MVETEMGTAIAPMTSMHTTIKKSMLIVFVSAATLAGCQKVVTSPPPPPAPPPPPPPPRSLFNHVFIVVEENTNYATAIGNSSMPYLNSLAEQYGLATQYYADTHPSIGNYFMMTVGDTITNNDDYSGPLVTEDNVVRELLKAGKTWKSYAEDLPHVGYTGPDVGNYARRHNTVALLADVAGDSTQVKNLVPFSQFATDLANNSLPNYAFIVPNLCDDAHDCALSTADSWLQRNIDPLIKSAQFQRDGVLIILFDESDSDNSHGGGRIPWVTVSAKAKRGFQSNTLYQHESTLRLSLDALGVRAFPNHAASAPDMTEFYQP